MTVIDVVIWNQRIDFESQKMTLGERESMRTTTLTVIVFDFYPFVETMTFVFSAHVNVCIFSSPKAAQPTKRHKANQAKFKVSIVIEIAANKRILTYQSC